MSKSLEIVNERINELKGVPELECYNKQKIKYLFHNGEGAGLLTYSELEIIKQDLETLKTILDNCENKFLDILHECLIRGTPIHTEDILRLSGYINKILTIKTMVGGK